MQTLFLGEWLKSAGLGRKWGGLLLLTALKLDTSCAIDTLDMCLSV